MTRTFRLTLVLSVIALVAAACGDGTSASTTVPATAAPAPTSSSTSSTTTAAPTTTAAATTTQAPASAPFEINDAGEVSIDWAALEGTIFFAPPAAGSSDPFFFVHNDPATDGFFLSVEAYTAYGTAWTGELGMFTIDCSPSGSGICVHFDPDGPGPIGDLGADFLVTGDIEIVQADADGFEAVLTNVAFTDGTTIPGPVTITD